MHQAVPLVLYNRIWFRYLDIAHTHQKKNQTQANAFEHSSKRKKKSFAIAESCPCWWTFAHRVPKSHKLAFIKRGKTLKQSVTFSFHIQFRNKFKKKSTMKLWNNVDFGPDMIKSHDAAACWDAGNLPHNAVASWSFTGDNTLSSYALDLNILFVHLPWKSEIKIKRNIARHQYKVRRN